MEREGLLREGQTAASLEKHVTVSANLQEALSGALYVQVNHAKSTIHPPCMLVLKKLLQKICTCFFSFFSYVQVVL